MDKKIEKAIESYKHIVQFLDDNGKTSYSALKTIQFIISRGKTLSSGKVIIEVFNKFQKEF